MKKILFLFILVTLSFRLHAQREDLLPTQVNNNQVIIHTYYALSYNELHEQADWVAYNLTSTMVSGNVPRSDNFRPDPRVQTISAQLSDYKGSGYDRGHLAPAADFKHSTIAMSESFFMSNMSPQEPSFNRGIWKKLESLVRSWAINEEEVYVVTAGILTSTKGSIGSNSVSIPTHYYKIVYDYQGEEKMIGFILPNTKGTKNLDAYAVSIDFIEKETGIDFFHNLPDNKEELLESSIDISLWNWDVRTSSRSQGEAGKDSTSSVRCPAYTKSGTRCKRMTTNSNGRCWQHQ